MEWLKASLSEADSRSFTGPVGLSPEVILTRLGFGVLGLRENSSRMWPDEKSALLVGCLVWRGIVRSLCLPHNNIDLWEKTAYLGALVAISGRGILTNHERPPLHTQGISSKERAGRVLVGTMTKLTKREAWTYGVSGASVS